MGSLLISNICYAFRSIFLPVEVDGDIRPAAGDLSKSQWGDVAPGPERLVQHISDFLQAHLPRCTHDPVTQTHTETLIFDHTM